MKINWRHNPSFSSGNLDTKQFNLHTYDPRFKFQDNLQKDIRCHICVFITRLNLVKGKE